MQSIEVCEVENVLTSVMDMYFSTIVWKNYNNGNKAFEKCNNKVYLTFWYSIVEFEKRNEKIRSTEKVSFLLIFEGLQIKETSDELKTVIIIAMVFDQYRPFIYWYLN